MTFDVARARRETPGCEGVLHFNNAGAALPPQPVLDAVKGHLDLEARLGGYEAAAAAGEAVHRTHDALAELLNCTREEIAVVENATRAWDMAFYALPFGPGDRILTARAEYASNYIAYLHASAHRGVSVEPVPNDESGQLDVDRLAAMIDDRVRLIAVTHVPTNGGLINPAEEIGRIARAAGIPYLLDACQSVGHFPVDVERLGCDILSGTGRKYLRGPRGTGFLYVRREWIERLDPPFLDDYAADWIAPDAFRVHPDARRFETWEGNVAGKIGLGVAADYARGWGLDAIGDRVFRLAETLRAGLEPMPGVTLRDLGRRRCGIVTFTVDSMTPSEVQTALARDRINVLASPRKYTLLDMEERGLEEVVRASVHYYNTGEEISRFLSRLARLTGRA